ncbi:hypothetical protein TNCV_239181 [Trichonephila clavipes]|nr:hypothetical protein TNCV_239181 [Trichonephila clavipes]
MVGSTHSSQSNHKVPCKFTNLLDSPPLAIDWHFPLLASLKQEKKFRDFPERKNDTNIAHSESSCLYILANVSHKAVTLIPFVLHSKLYLP